MEILHHQCCPLITAPPLSVSTTLHTLRNVLPQTSFPFISGKENCRNLFLFHPQHNPINPFSTDVWDSYEILEINKGVLWDPMLLKVILKPIKVMITRKILGPYLKNSARYRDLKNLSFWDFVLPWLTEIDITRSIFEIQGSYFGFIPLFRLYDQFW